MKEFDIASFDYNLHDDRIAKYPLESRDQSKLLIWKNGSIEHKRFNQAPNLLPANSLLVFNDTKVIAARLRFKKASGANIEIFLLHPEKPTRDIAEAMNLDKECVWSCMIGNKRRWKEGTLTLNVGNAELEASYFDRDLNLIRFQWNDGSSFANLVNAIGKTPLPPYLHREAEESDSTRYQTIYSRNDGAVAAPTAGLHFTENVLKQFGEKDIGLEYLTLHVSAGTFKPVEAEDYRDHDMHREQIIVTRSSLENIMRNWRKIIAVGTTSLRILESLYWYAVKLQEDPKAPFFIAKDAPYQGGKSTSLSFGESLDLLLSHMDRNRLAVLHGETEIFIHPGYEINSAIGLFTNFHLPKSTLLLLVSAFTGGSWKQIYEEALQHDYRFLSYGDSSLLLR